jgi:DNA-binding HxlR family transcriptional regulator
MMPIKRKFKKARKCHEGTTLKPGEHEGTGNCRAISETLARIGDKWTVLVVEFLSDGPVRFNELRRTIDGISQRMLTLTLRGLERDGLVKRTMYPTIPPKVEYELTPLGRTLREPLGAISDWARTHRADMEHARELFDKTPAAKSVRSSPRRIAKLDRVARRVRV